MNTGMVKRLVQKDWYFFRWPIAFYIGAGLACIAALGNGGEGAFYAGCVGLLTVLISVGIHLTMGTVIEERRTHTLTFVMSLPISSHEYTLAKILANMTIFGLAWTTLFVATIAVITGRGGVPDGLIPFAAVILGEIFFGYCLTLCVAIVSESQGWTIGAMIVANLLLQATMYTVSHAPAVARSMKTDAIVWQQPISGLLAAEIGAILLMLVLTFYLQARKTDFL
jgi:ABC-type transport system involved in multi-copper enzyme maturation permease subunit